MADREIQMGDIWVTKNLDNLAASGVGSCLIITLYDPNLKIGALAHAMLPSPVTGNPSSVTEHRTRNTEYESQDTKYVDTAIDEMLKRMEACGAKREGIEAKIVGGANMFPGLESDIGKKNVLGAKEKLKKEGIKIVGESVGGSIGRSVEFCVASGIVTVKIKF